MKKSILLLTAILSAMVFGAPMCQAKTVLTYVNTVVYERDYEVTKTEVYNAVNAAAKKEQEEGKTPVTQIFSNTTTINTTSSTSLKGIMSGAASGIFRK